MKTYRNNKMQIVGCLKDGVFRKKVQKSKHLMRNANGWAISDSILTSLRKEECKEIRIKDTENSLIYSIEFKHFMAYSTVIGYQDVQRVLPTHYFGIVFDDKDIPVTHR